MLFELVSPLNTAAALKFVKSTVAPVRVNVPLIDNVRPAAALHACAPSKVSPLLMVTSLLAADRLIPEAPSVSVLPALITIAPFVVPAFNPSQVRFAPKLRFPILPEEIVESKRATSAAVG